MLLRSVLVLGAVVVGAAALENRPLYPRLNGSSVVEKTPPDDRTECHNCPVVTVTEYVCGYECGGNQM
jgi:hypothetical protein